MYFSDGLSQSIVAMINIMCLTHHFHGPSVFGAQVLEYLELEKVTKWTLSLPDIEIVLDAKS